MCLNNEWKQRTKFFCQYSKLKYSETSVDRNWRESRLISQFFKLNIFELEINVFSNFRVIKFLQLYSYFIINYCTILAVGVRKILVICQTVLLFLRHYLSSHKFSAFTNVENTLLLTSSRPSKNKTFKAEQLL